MRLTLRFLLIGIGAAAVLLLILVAVLDRPISPALWLLLWIAALSALTLAVYGWDKRQSKGKGLRAPEAVLHLLSALGGSPGAFLGMRLFHHKTGKQGFQAIFWLIVAFQVGALAWWLLGPAQQGAGL